jgi:hypothetical protein
MNNAQLTRLKALHTGLRRYVSGTVYGPHNSSFGIAVPNWKKTPKYTLNNYTNKNKAFNFFHRQLQHELKRRANAGLGVPKLLKNLLNQNAVVQRNWFKQFPKDPEGAHAVAKQKFKNQINLRILENNLLARFISLNKVRTPREKEAVETFKKYYFSPDPRLRGKVGRGRQRLNQERERRAEEKSPQRPPNNAGLSARKAEFRQWARSAKRRRVNSIMR